MFAIIETGGAQVKVWKNYVFKTQRLTHDSKDPFCFDKVLMVGDEKKTTLGAPFVEKARVLGEIIGQERSKKVIVFKKKRRHNHRRKNGHRQHLTCVRVVDIILPEATKI